MWVCILIHDSYQCDCCMICFCIYIYIFLQEKFKRENLRQTLELKSTEREEKMQQAFATALEMQQQSADEAAALKDELARTKRKSQQAIDALAAQVGHLTTIVYLFFRESPDDQILLDAGEPKAQGSYGNNGTQVF